jgi:hypothetical protein
MCVCVYQLMEYGKGVLLCWGECVVYLYLFDNGASFLYKYKRLHKPADSLKREVERRRFLYYSLFLFGITPSSRVDLQIPWNVYTEAS